MKALSLIQPWATLIAIGAKTIETRDWPTDYRGPLAIHASKWLEPTGRMKRGVEDYLALCREEPFTTALTLGGVRTIRDLPSGAIVATAHLVDVVRTTAPRLDRVTVLEREFGNFAPGRYAWLLADVRPLPAPVPCRGMPGLWEVPDAVLEVIRA